MKRSASPPTRPSSCAICVTRPPTVQRRIEGDDFFCWICAVCDGQTAVSRPAPDRGYEVPDRDPGRGTGDTLQRFRAGAARVVPNVASPTPYLGRTAHSGFLPVLVARRRPDGTPLDRAEARQTLASKPWFAEVRYVGCDLRWYIFERPDDKLAAAARSETTYDAAAALHQLSTTPRDRAYQAQRRDANLASERCINENKRGTHGPATDGVRCAACAAVHRRTA